MTVKEFFDGIGGDYCDAVSRLMNDTLIRKFVLRFPADKSFDTLKAALESGDTEAAFVAAHTLKGVALNLAFKKLAEAAITLTDALRPENRAGYTMDHFSAMFREVDKEYGTVSAAIMRLDRGL